MSIEGKTRRDILLASKKVGRIGAHIAPSLSIVEICLAALQSIKNDDVFILSKGHGALGYYAAMLQENLISEKQFFSFEENGGDFPGQPSRSKNNKIKYSSGSLGMGLSYGVGRAWMNKKSSVIVVMGDGELEEGSVWEAAALASQLNINNLIAIVDVNGLQSDGKCEDIISLKIGDIWQAYGWTVLSCDGHSLDELKSCINNPDIRGPRVVLAKTIKGKGISFMENNNEWHHHELKEEMFESAILDLEENYGVD